MMKNFPGIRLLASVTLSMSVLLAACSQQEDETRDVASYIERSKSYSQQGQFKAAIIESRNALQLAPTSPDALLSLADIYDTLHYVPSTIQLLEPHKESADVRIRIALAGAYAEKGKLRSANDLLAQIPNDLTPEQTHQVTLLKARIAIAQQDYSGARSLLTTLPNDNEATLQLAQIELLQQRWNEAAALLDPLAKAGNLEAQQMQARIAAGAGQLEKAEEILTNLLIALPKTDVLMPQRASVLRELMQVVTRQGRSNEALVYAKILADSAPEQAQIEDKLEDAVESYRKGDLATSKKLLTELHENSGNKEVTGQFLGLISFMQGDTQAAEQLLSTYLDPETATNKALHMLAISQINQHKPKELIKLLEGDRKKLESDALLQAFYGVAQMMEGQRDKGISALKRSIALDNKQIYAPLALARAHLAQKQEADALQVLNSALKENPDNRRLQSAIVGVHMQIGGVKAAQQFLDSQLKQKPDSFELLLLAGVVQMSDGANDKAKDFLLKAQKLQPNNPSVTAGLAQLAMRQKQWSEAREQFTHLIALVPGNAHGYEGLLAAFSAENKADAGTETLQQMVKNSDAAGVPLAVLARHALASGNGAQAEDYALRAVKSSPDDKYVTTTVITIMPILAQQALARGDYDNARLTLVRTLELAPSNTTLLAQLAQIEIRSGHEKEAQKIADQLATEQPASGWSKVLRGDILSHQDKHAEALELYREAWDTEKSDHIANRLVAGLQASGGDEKAISAFITEWLDAIPASSHALLRLAMLQQGTGANDDAIRSYEKLLAGNGNHVVALNNVAWLYLEKSDPRALQTAERAYQLAQDDAAVADTYGWVLVKSGKADAGIGILEQALAKAPDSADIKAHLEQAKKSR